jgi:hypothetical protein
LLQAEAQIGAMKLRWKTGLRRCWFQVQWIEGWQGDVWATRGRAVVPDLKSGVVYSFRVLAHNTNGQSNWSQTVTARVN